LQNSISIIPWDNPIFLFADQQVIVVPSLQEQKQLIREAHSGRGPVRDAQSLQSKALGGHFGRDKTASLLQQQYYFPQLYQKVQEVIKCCDVCQRVNSGSKLDKGGKALSIVPVPNDTWKKIGIDLLGPLPEYEGMKYIVTAVDYFTKWPEAKALPDKKGETVAEFIYELICRYGVADVHITDQGTDFNNRFSDELCRLSGIKHINTAAYHPQTNGLVEKQNDTTEKIIFKHCEKADKWVDLLPGVLFNVRTSKHASTGFTPMVMMFGREAVHPLFFVDDQSKGNPRTLSQEERQEAVDSLSTVEKMDKIREFRQEVFEKSTYNIKRAQVSYKKHYDRRHAHRNLAIGEKVLKRDMKNRGRKAKMGRSDLGPYTIRAIHKSGGYLLTDKYGKELVRPVPPNQVKRYHCDEECMAEQGNEADAENSGESSQNQNSQSEGLADEQRCKAQSWDELTEVEFVLSDGTTTSCPLEKSVSFDEEDRRVEAILMEEINELYGAGTVGQLVWDEKNVLPPRNNWEATEGLSPAAMCIANLQTCHQHALKTVERVAEELQQTLGLSQITTVVGKLLCKVVANLKGKLRFNVLDHTVSLTKASHPSPPLAPTYEEDAQHCNAKPTPAPRRRLAKKKTANEPIQSSSESSTATVKMDTPDTLTDSDRPLFPTDTSVDDSDISVVLGEKAAKIVFVEPPPAVAAERKLLPDSESTDVPAGPKKTGWETTDPNETNSDGIVKKAVQVVKPSPRKQEITSDSDDRPPSSPPAKRARRQLNLESKGSASSQSEGSAKSVAELIAENSDNDAKIIRKYKSLRGVDQEPVPEADTSAHFLEEIGSTPGISPKFHPVSAAFGRTIAQKWGVGDRLGTDKKMPKYERPTYNNVGGLLEGIPVHTNNIPGDGYCFYWAICRILFGTPKPGPQTPNLYKPDELLTLRTNINNFICGNTRVLRDIFPDPSMTGLQFLESLKTSDHPNWATEVHIFALARLLKRDIWTYQAPTRFGDAAPGRWDMGGWSRFPGCMRHSSEAIYLFQGSLRNHYEVVLGPQERADK